MTQGNWKLSEHKNLNNSELAKIFRVAKKDGHRTYIMVILSYNAALSVSELIHLKVADFDFKANTVSIIPLKKAGRRKMRLNGKVKVVNRDLPDPVQYPIPVVVVELVKLYVMEEGLTPNSYLFPGRTKKSCKIVKLKCEGGHISKREVQGIFDRVVAQAGLKKKGRGIHSLKHARLSDIAKKTNDPNIVREVGRHQSLAMGLAYVQSDPVNSQDELVIIIEKIGGKI